MTLLFLQCIGGLLLECFFAVQQLVPRECWGLIRYDFLKVEGYILLNHHRHTITHSKMSQLNVILL